MMIIFLLQQLPFVKLCSDCEFCRDPYTFVQSSFQATHSPLRVMQPITLTLETRKILHMLLFNSNQLFTDNFSNYSGSMSLNPYSVLHYARTERLP